MNYRMNELMHMDHGLSAFSALGQAEQDFVLAVVHGASNGRAAADAYPELANPRDKGMRLRQREDISRAIEEIRSMRHAEQDLSRERMVDELLLLRERIRSVGESPKHLELELRILQEMNKMAGHIVAKVDHTHREVQAVEIIYEMPSAIAIDIPNESEDKDQDQTNGEAGAGSPTST
jgi:hypothetical protein